MRHELKEVLDRNLVQLKALLDQLGFNGTPSFVIGDNLVPGIIEEEELRSLVEDVRASQD